MVYQRRYFLFLFFYSKCMEVDQWYIKHLSSFGLTSILVCIFSVQCRFLANKGKGDISFFLFSKCMKVDQWYIARLSSFCLTSIIVYVFLSNAIS